MALEPGERDELAKFFAKRLTTALQPRQPQVSPDQQGWSERLEEANLSQLAQQISDACPHDANVQLACKELRRLGENRLPVQFLAFGLAATALAVVGLTAWPHNPTAEAAVVPQLASTALAAPASQHVKKTPSTPQVASKTDTVEAADERGKDPSNPSPLAGLSDEGGGAPNPTLTPCADLQAGVVGYWYAGTTSPGSAGDTIQIDSWINVRQALPAYRNDWDTKSSVECVLRPGDVVTLHRDPEFVPRDSYWIPMRAQDVTSSS
jgi:hypothetical protein